MVLTALFLLPLQINAQEDIGSVYEQTGPAVVERDEEDLTLEQNASIRFLDNVKTGAGSVGINFIDDTVVAISPQSSLVIDDFVYDPANSDGSSLGLSVALGTVRYTSGNIARLNRQNVDIRTPTARVGVRGTAFSMTVNEVGKSLIILLPNADGSVGEIEVVTSAGSQVLTRPFESVVTTYLEAPPSQSVILDLSMDMISNLLIISPPREILEEIVDDNDTLSGGILDVDLLEFTGLEENELEDDLFEFNELDINELDVELLGNILDQIEQALAQSELVDGRTPGFNQRTQVFTVFVSEAELRLIRKLNGNDVVLNLSRDSGYVINMNQGGSPVPEITTSDETVNNITIIQSQ